MLGEESKTTKLDVHTVLKTMLKCTVAEFRERKSM